MRHLFRLSLASLSYYVLAFPFALYAQDATFPYHIELQEVSIAELGGTQSYAFGQTATSWLIVGGRLDGLHRRQPWATFDLAGHNDQLIVVDPAAGTQWRRNTAELPVDISEQLRTTNMVFFQEGDYLYLIGGYGYSAQAGDHITFGAMLVLNLPALVEAIQQGGDLTPHIRRYEEARFAVTGGQVALIDGTYHLAGGQRFMGRYNPHGPDHGPGFIQEYTNEVRRFRLQDDGRSLNLTFLPALTDTAAFHRRDYNALPQILPDGRQGMTIFSGVFRTDADLPYLNAITIDTSGYAEEPNFNQFYNHYHCAKIPLYSAARNHMHNIFFGGIAQYYLDENGTRIQDDDVPFVRTIARVSRDAAGELEEVVLPVQMPALLGAGAEFIPNTSLPFYPNDVIDLDALPSDTTLLGYIYGGIRSSGRNIFWINDGTQSSATSQIYALYLVSDTSVDAVEALQSDFALSVFPNPSANTLTIQFELPREATRTTLTLYNSQGQLTWSRSIDTLRSGIQLYHFPEEERATLPAGVYHLEVRTAWGRALRKLVLE